MAISASVLGEVQPAERFIDYPSQPARLKSKIVDVTLSSSGDYSSGFSLANVLTAVGGNAIVGAVVINARVAAGTALFGFGSYSTATGLVRFFAAIASQTSATDYTAANGDIFRLRIDYI